MGGGEEKRGGGGGGGGEEVTYHDSINDITIMVLESLDCSPTASLGLRHDEFDVRLRHASLVNGFLGFRRFRRGSGVFGTCGTSAGSSSACRGSLRVPLLHLFVNLPLSGVLDLGLYGEKQKKREGER